MKRSILLVLFSVVFVFGVFLYEGHSQIRETGKPAMQCEKNFEAMDTNHDGLVTKEEFLAFEHMGVKNPEELFKARDTDKKGTLTKEEFCAGRGAGPGGGRQPQ